MSSATSRPWKLLPFLIVLGALLLFPRLSPAAQDLARRLILKDGSYQLVTKYEIKGDRVRYMSAERDDWEELPTSLIDWPATDLCRPRPRSIEGSRERRRGIGATRCTGGSSSPSAD